MDLLHTMEKDMQSEILKLMKAVSVSSSSALTKIYAGVKNLRGRIRASISNTHRVFGTNTREYFKYSRVF